MVKELKACVERRKAHVVDMEVYSNIYHILTSGDASRARRVCSLEIPMLPTVRSSRATQCSNLGLITYGDSEELKAQLGGDDRHGLYGLHSSSYGISLVTVKAVVRDYQSQAIGSERKHRQRIWIITIMK